MRKIALILVFCLIASGCELIILRSKYRVPVVELTQKNPLGTVYLFKAELDSNNLKGATELMLQANGSPYLAIQKYELYDDLRRLKRIIGFKPVTKSQTDSISPLTSKVSVEFDYLKNITFNIQKIKDLWFIVGYNEGLNEENTKK